VKTYRWIAALGVLALLPAAGADAETLRVPEDHGSVQQAVLAAAYGDTVLVAPGNYYEFIQMKNGVTLKSAEGPDGTTLVSPGLGEKPIDERLIEIPAGSDETTRVEGFTMDADSHAGCAIYVDSATPEIRGNRIIEFGWGIHLNYADALIEDNEIVDPGAFGILVRASSPRIFRNAVSGCAQQAISISGKSSRPLIGGSAENRNRFFNNLNSVVNGSKNDVDATWNDWGWETAAEMDAKGYPADILALRDGNDAESFGAGKGKVDYRHWVSATTPAGGGEPVTAAPEAEPDEDRELPIVPIAGAVVLLIVFVVVARKRAG
jgi:nitrous oxidase accessory protein NosD